jgi:hypothetical protein
MHATLGIYLVFSIHQKVGHVLYEVGNLFKQLNYEYCWYNFGFGDSSLFDTYKTIRNMSGV